MAAHHRWTHYHSQHASPVECASTSVPTSFSFWQKVLPLWKIGKRIIVWINAISAMAVKTVIIFAFATRRARCFPRWWWRTKNLPTTPVLRIAVTFIRHTESCVYFTAFTGPFGGRRAKMTKKCIQTVSNSCWSICLFAPRCEMKAWRHSLGLSLSHLSSVYITFYCCTTYLDPSNHFDNVTHFYCQIWREAMQRFDGSLTYDRSHRTESFSYDFDSITIWLVSHIQTCSANCKCIKYVCLWCRITIL